MQAVGMAYGGISLSTSILLSLSVIKLPVLHPEPNLQGTFLPQFHFSSLYPTAPLFTFPLFPCPLPGYYIGYIP